MAQKVTLALLQHDCSSDKQENTRHAIELVRQAAARGAQIILLQELFRSLYFCQRAEESAFDLAEEIPGRFCETLQLLAAELGVVIAASLFERRTPGIYHNTMVVIDADGRYLGKYRKMHIPEDPGFHEKYYFTPGDLGYKVFKTQFGTIGTLICWDQWFPEAARLTAMQGAQILVYPTAIASLPEEADTHADRYLDAWITVQRSHAIANGCFVASVNRTGREGALSFWGNSFVCDPLGHILCRAGKNPEILVQTIDLDDVERVRRTWPFFRDRRVDSYHPICDTWDDQS